VIPDSTPLALQSLDTAMQWQARVRIALALFGGAAATAGALLAPVPGSQLAVTGVFVAYLALVGATYVTARYAPSSRPFAAPVLSLADVALVLGATALLSSPDGYDRALLLSFVLVHASQFYFGRGQAYLVVAATSAGYLGLVFAGAPRGSGIDWTGATLSLAIFVVASTLFVEQYATVRRRLSRLVTLFERAEDGDFSHEYDVSADRRPDVVTVVGHAYNRLRARLEGMILTDSLTGCLNRRGFDQALAREMARSSRTGGEIALLAIDLDHFKRLNDRLGHLAGDAILRDLGALLRHAVRAGDVVARTGGEEFTLILPHTSPEGGFQLATRLCERIRDRAFQVEGKSLKITVSVGVAAASGAAVNHDGHQLKLRADQALYAAKRLGRDRALTWNE
jgi:diguanylate cyclase (GGDEF)-like protein